MIPGRSALEAARDDGLTQAEAAARFACGRSTIRRLVQRHAIIWPNRHSFRPSVFVHVRGECLSLAEVARRYGFERQTITKRFENGDRGERLIRPLRNWTPPPSHYDLGLTRQDWNVVVSLARQTTDITAARRLDLPLGAVRAALRGQWERLG